MTLLLSITILINSMANGVDSQLVESIIKVESEFDSTKTGTIGEIGLMQIRKEYWQGPLNLYEPELNIGVGTQMLSKLKRLQPTLGKHYYVAWNLGATGAKRFNKKKHISKFTYAEKVTQQLKTKMLLVAIN